jgi:prolyl-tRNA editing enzyme YbaK/EbsC (Cys-tRNA(Pro) deacylase)
VVLDEALLRHDRIWGAAGDGHSLFSIEPRRLVDCTSGTVASVAA